MEVVETGERARQLRLDEAQRAAPAFESDLDEDPRTLLDVVAGSLHDSGDLTKLRDYAARPLGLWRIRKEGLARETAPDDLRVDLRISLPGPYHLQLVHPSLDAGRHDRMVHPLDSGEVGRIDLMKATAEAG